MIYFDSKKYDLSFCDKLKEHIKEIETDCGIKILFGGAYSAHAFGYATSTSDIDFYFCFESQTADFTQKWRFFDDIFCDVNLISYDLCLQNTKKMMDEIPIYPSVLTKNTQHESWSIHYDDFFSTTKFFEILLSSCIYDTGFLAKNIDKILSVIDIPILLDYYYTRAYGNLKDHLSKDYVEAKRVIRAFFGYSVLRAVIENRVIPSADITELIDKYADTDQKIFLSDTLNQMFDHKVAVTKAMHMPQGMSYDELSKLTKEEARKIGRAESKQVLMIPRNDKFNSFLADGLTKTAEDIKEFVNLNKRDGLKLGASIFAEALK